MNNNMQDILKNYYANGGRELFETREDLDEGVFTTAMVFAGLAALIGGAQIDPVQKGLNSEVNQIVQDINKDSMAMDIYKYDPDFISKALGVPLDTILDPEFSKEVGRPRAGKTNDTGTFHISRNTLDVSYSKNQMDAKKISPVYTYGEYNLNVLRSSEPITMNDKQQPVYLTGCVIEATVSRNGNYYYAEEFFQFYHIYSKEIHLLDKCNPGVIVDKLDTAFKTNPLLIDPNRP